THRRILQPLCSAYKRSVKLRRLTDRIFEDRQQIDRVGCRGIYLRIRLRARAALDCLASLLREHLFDFFALNTPAVWNRQAKAEEIIRIGRAVDVAVIKACELSGSLRRDALGRRRCGCSARFDAQASA